MLEISLHMYAQLSASRYKGKWIYIALLLSAHTQGAQIWITQFYLQVTSYLPLPRRRSPDGATTDI